MLGFILEHYQIIHFRKWFFGLMYSGQLNDIRKNKIHPCTEEIVSETNNRLGTNVTATDIEKLIELDPDTGTTEETEHVGRTFVFPISGRALQQKTLSYNTAEAIAKFIFRNATKDTLARNKKVRDVAERVILQGALSKIEETYGAEYVNNTEVNEDAVEDFTRCTAKKDFFKKEIVPLLKPGNDDTVFRKLRSESKKSEGEEDLKNPVYQKYRKFEEMESRLSETDMVRLTINEDVPIPHNYAYVRGLKYIYEHENCRLIDISKGLGIPVPTAYFLAIKHSKKTKFVEKIGRRYRVTEKYRLLRQKEQTSTGIPPV